ncbi:MAG: TIGR01244 family sulfur transferase [Azospirillaceae bacterium]
MSEPKRLTAALSVMPQLDPAQVPAMAARGFKSIVNNRPDGEQDGQPRSAEIEAAARSAGLAYAHLPVVPGKIGDADVAAFSELLTDLPGPVLAFCRTGTRSASLWALGQAGDTPSSALIDTAKGAGYDLSGLRPRLEAARAAVVVNRPAGAVEAPAVTHDVLIVGGGAGGIAVASSLARQRPGLDVAIIEPSEVHHYQPGWTLVAANAFRLEDTRRDEASLIPRGVKWIRAAVAGFEPEHDRVVLEDGERVGYRQLVIAPGLKLNWAGIEGLADTLGRNGVTSNYHVGLQPYTWELLSGLKRGTALFTQPPMPIKCAGAPQKIMYLACHHWERAGVLKDIAVEFDNAGAVLFGVKEFVPPLMDYVGRYGIDLAFNSNLVAIDGPAKKAVFEVTDADGGKSRVEKSFDMIHVTPPQIAPDFVRASPLAAESGWLAVDQETLRHPTYDNVYGVGDVVSAPNAKTAAAVRKQSPVVVHNVLRALDGKAPDAVYDGYGSCPLVVERGRVILAEFGYGGKLMPTFPFDQTKPRRSMWLLKTRLLPWLYWDVLFRGREWGAKPTLKKTA